METSISQGYDIVSEDVVDGTSEVFVECQCVDFFEDLRLLVRDIPSESEEYYFEVISARRYLRNVLCIAIYKMDKQAPDAIDGLIHLKPFKKIIFPEEYDNPILLRHLAYYYASKADPEWGKRNNVNSFNIHGIIPECLVHSVRRISIN